MRAVPVPPAKTAAAWPVIESWVARALVKGKADLTPAQIREHLERGGMQLWLAWGPGNKPHGACITELIESARGRTCNVVIVAGNRFAAWEHLQARIAAWAVGDWGCKRLALTGRVGWARRLRAAGWEQTHVSMERTLDEPV
jgi:hypothetical protein